MTKVLFFIEEMKKKNNIKHNKITYNTLIKIFGAKGDYDKTLSYFEDMKKKQH